MAFCLRRPPIIGIWAAMARHGVPCSHVIFAWQVCALRIAAMLHTHGRKSAGAHVLDRQDQTWVDDDGDDDGDDGDDDDGDDDYNVIKG